MRTADKTPIRLVTALSWTVYNFPHFTAELRFSPLALPSGVLMSIRSCVRSVPTCFTFFVIEDHDGLRQPRVTGVVLYHERGTDLGAAGVAERVVEEDHVAAVDLHGLLS